MCFSPSICLVPCIMHAVVKVKYYIHIEEGGAAACKGKCNSRQLVMANFSKGFTTSECLFVFN